MPDQGAEAGVVLEDCVLAGVDEVCAEFAGLVDADLGGVVRWGLLCVSINRH